MSTAEFKDAQDEDDLIHVDDPYDPNIFEIVEPVKAIEGGILLPESDELPTDDGYDENRFSSPEEHVFFDAYHEHDFDPAVDAEDLAQERELMSLFLEKLDPKIRSFVKSAIELGIGFMTVDGKKVSFQELPGMLSDKNVTVVLSNPFLTKGLLKDGLTLRGNRKVQRLRDEESRQKVGKKVIVRKKDPSVRERRKAEWEEMMYRRNLRALDSMFAHYFEVRAMIAKTLEGRDLNAEYDQAEAQLKPGEDQLSYILDSQIEDEIRDYENSAQGEWDMRMNASAFNRSRSLIEKRKVEK